MSRIEWIGEDEFSIGEIHYECRPAIRECFESSSVHFCLRKPREAVEAYERLLGRLQPQRVVELGLMKGGSTALIAQLANPAKLVGVELTTQPILGLDDFIAESGLRDRLAIHYGVDQADRERLAAIAAREFGGSDLDLVIDDASHQLAETRATFETLFPLLGEGGEFLLEDWAWAHAAVEMWPRKPPLTSLLFALTVVCAHSPEVVAGIEIEPGWALIRRGPARLAAGFRIEDHCGRRGHDLLAGTAPAVASPQRRARWRRRSRR